MANTCIALNSVQCTYVVGALHRIQRNFHFAIRRPSQKILAFTDLKASCSADLDLDAKWRM